MKKPFLFLLVFFTAQISFGGGETLPVWLDDLKGDAVAGPEDVLKCAFKHKEKKKFWMVFVEKRMDGVWTPVLAAGDLRRTLVKLPPGLTCAKIIELVRNQPQKGKYFLETAFDLQRTSGVYLRGDNPQSDFDVNLEALPMEQGDKTVYTAVKAGDEIRIEIYEMGTDYKSVECKDSDLRLKAEHRGRKTFTIGKVKNTLKVEAGFFLGAYFDSGAGADNLNPFRGKFGAGVQLYPDINTRDFDLMTLNPGFILADPTVDGTDRFTWGLSLKLFRPLLLLIDRHAGEKYGNAFSFYIGRSGNENMYGFALDAVGFDLFK